MSEKSGTEGRLEDIEYSELNFDFEKAEEADGGASAEPEIVEDSELEAAAVPTAAEAEIQREALLAAPPEPVVPAGRTGLAPAARVRQLWSEHRWLTVGLVVALVVVIAVVVAVMRMMGPGGGDGDSDKAMLEGASPEQATQAAGGSCAALQASGRRTCQIDGVVFYLAPGTWEAKAGERERDCAAGVVSDATKVLTNGSWVIYSNGDNDLIRVGKALRDKGAPARMTGYCDYDE